MYFARYERWSTVARKYVLVEAAAIFLLSEWFVGTVSLLEMWSGKKRVLTSSEEK